MNALRRLWHWLITQRSSTPQEWQLARLERAAREMEQRQRVFDEQFRVDSATRRGEQG